MAEAEQILEEYIKRGGVEGDNLLRASVGKLTADRTKELAEAVDHLREQLPLTGMDIRQTIATTTENLIKSNERLAKSNETYSRWIKWLTLALVLVGIAQVVVAWIRG